jgi:hypothetical protein
MDAAVAWLDCTENMAAKSNRKIAKKLGHFLPVFATMRRLSFNMHPWPYVKFM